MMYVLLVALIILVALNLIFFGYFGAFTKIVVAKETRPSAVLAYQTYQGKYSKVGPVMNALYADLIRDFQVSPTRGFGLYYDDPREVAAEQCRAVVGCVLDDTEDEKMAQIRERFSVVEMPESQALVVRFPYKGSLSIILGVLRVYRPLLKQIERQNIGSGPIMEIYDMPNCVIEYIRPYSLKNELLEQYLN